MGACNAGTGIMTQVCARSYLTYSSFQFYCKSPRELLFLPILQLRNKDSMMICACLAQDPRARKCQSQGLTQADVTLKLTAFPLVSLGDGTEITSRKSGSRALADGP